MNVGETPEVFDVAPADCPKCGGESFIDRYVRGSPVRDHRGEFSVQVMSPGIVQEHLVVKCRVCDYERLMHVWNEE